MALKVSEPRIWAVGWEKNKILCAKPGRVIILKSSIGPRLPLELHLHAPAE